MCEYCNFNNETYPEKYLYDDGIVEIWINDTSVIEVSEYNQQGDYYVRDSLMLDFKVKYCPMCGREL